MAIYLPQTLETLVKLGANITIEDGNYLPQTLIGLAQIAKKNKSSYNNMRKLSAANAFRLGNNSRE